MLADFSLKGKIKRISSRVSPSIKLIYVHVSELHANKVAKLPLPSKQHCIIPYKQRYQKCLIFQ